MSSDHDSEKETANALVRHLLGDTILSALAQPDTNEVFLNPDGVIWHQRRGHYMEPIGKLDDASAMALAAALAGTAGKEITRESPFVETELSLDGSRVSVQVPPIAVPGPALSIRKHASSVYPIDEYVRTGVMTENHARVLRDFVHRRKNILVVGGTGAGKTTLINAIIAETARFHPHARFVILEDTVELQCAAKNVARYRTSPEVPMHQLVRISLRMRPDITIVGEIRGAEALDLLDMWSSGHRGGAASIHSDSAALGVKRLVLAVSRNPLAPKPIEPLVVDAIDLVVNIQGSELGRPKLHELLTITGCKDHEFTFERLA